MDGRNQRRYDRATNCIKKFEGHDQNTYRKINKTTDKQSEDRKANLEWRQNVKTRKNQELLSEQKERNSND